MLDLPNWTTKFGARLVYTRKLKFLYALLDLAIGSKMLFHLEQKEFKNISKIWLNSKRSLFMDLGSITFLHTKPSDGNS